MDRGKKMFQNESTTVIQAKNMTDEQFEAKIKLIEEQKDTLKIEKLRLQTEERCRDFVPNGGQEEIIQAVVPETFIVVDSAANGWGKTGLEANIIANMIYGPMNDWFNTPFFQTFKRPSKGRIISDGTTVEEKIVPELQKWLIKGTYRAEKGGRTFFSKWHFKNGSYVDILTYDQDIKEFESVDLDWGVLDEKPLRSVYTATVARTRTGGFIFIGFAPLAASSWVFDDIVDRADGKKIIIHYGDIEENCLEHGIRGRLKHADIERMAAEYDPDEREARLHGRPQKFYGRVHKLFDRTIHGIDELPVGQYTYYMILDPHDARPPAISWDAINPLGHKYTIDEWPNESFHKMTSCTLNFDDIVKIIKHKEVDMKIDQKIFKRILDPWWYAHKYPNSQLTVAQEYGKRGIKFAPQIKLFAAFEETARKQLNEHLKYEKDPNDPNKFKIHPRWYVLNHCYNHIYALEHWTIGSLKGRAVETKEPKEEPEEKHQCFPKLLYYFLMSNPYYNFPKVETKKPELTPAERRFFKAGGR
jgi:phage terminase large subunit-like protein